MAHHMIRERINDQWCSKSGASSGERQLPRAELQLIHPVPPFRFKFKVMPFGILEDKHFAHNVHVRSSPVRIIVLRSDSCIKVPGTALLSEKDAENVGSKLKRAEGFVIARKSSIPRLEIIISPATLFSSRSRRMMEE